MRWFTRLSRLWLVACFALSGALGMSVWLAGVASAHASYDSSDPAAGAVLATAPTQVTVHFEQNINPAGENHERRAHGCYAEECIVTGEIHQNTQRTKILE